MLDPPPVPPWPVGLVPRHLMPFNYADMPSGIQTRIDNWWLVDHPLTVTMGADTTMVVDATTDAVQVTMAADTTLAADAIVMVDSGLIALTAESTLVADIEVNMTADATLVVDATVNVDGGLVALEGDSSMTVIPYSP